MQTGICRCTKDQEEKERKWRVIHKQNNILREKKRAEASVSRCLCIAMKEKTFCCWLALLIRQLTTKSAKEKRQKKNQKEKKKSCYFLCWCTKVIQTSEKGKKTKNLRSMQSVRSRIHRRANACRRTYTWPRKHNHWQETREKSWRNLLLLYSLPLYMYKQICIITCQKRASRKRMKNDLCLFPFRQTCTRISFPSSNNIIQEKYAFFHISILFIDNLYSEERKKKKRFVLGIEHLLIIYILPR